MSVQPDHELEILEYDQTVPPRPEEVIADAGRAWEGDVLPPPDESEAATPE
jgi:hypothetical protein